MEVKTIVRDYFEFSIYQRDSCIRTDAYAAKKVAVPMLSSEGRMKINKQATQTATQHRKKILRSRPLKWSRNGGNRRFFAAITGGAALSESDQAGEDSCVVRSSAMMGLGLFRLALDGPRGHEGW